MSRQRAIKIINSKKYYERIKDDDEIMNRIRKQKLEYYTNNRDKINEKDRIKYNENWEFKERKRNNHESTITKKMMMSKK